jgi:hypothetical protein
MSSSIEWSKRQALHRYSQDDRVLSYKYCAEIKPMVDTFLNNLTEKKLVVGTFDVSKESWRLISISEYRKYNLKLVERVVDTSKPNIKEIGLVKQKLSKQSFA